MKKYSLSFRSWSKFSLLVFLSYSVHAGSITKSNTFTSGESISRSKVNANFDSLYTEMNLKESRLSKFETAITPLTNGNVGIGTSNPGYLLEVNGNANFVGQVYRPVYTVVIAGAPSSSTYNAGYSYANWNMSLLVSPNSNITSTNFVALNGATSFVPPVKGIWTIRCILSGTNVSEPYISKNLVNGNDLNVGDSRLMAAFSGSQVTMVATDLLLTSDKVTCGSYSGAGQATYNGRSLFGATLIQAVP